ncbi:MAG: carbon-nitrogen hydrolase family protein [Hyphomicrobiaceae bacterium]
MKIAAIQMNPVSDVAANIEKVQALVTRCIDLEGPDWICLPETWNWAGGSTRDKVANACVIPGGRAYEAAQQWAARHKVWVHAGSLLEAARDENGNALGKVHNTTVVFDRTGAEAARYRKIHLFDIVTPDGTAYRESASVVPGREIVTYDCEGLRVGCAICYDLRFPELFQALAAAGAELITLPSAFTLQTGKDHWDVLCRARAIETQAYVVAPAQCGSFIAPGNERRYTWGHTLIVDPWGHIIAKASDGEGFTTARIDKAFIARCRAQIPVADHKVIGRGMPPVTFGSEA